MSNLVVQTREESKLLFIGGKVYKLFLTPLVTHGVIKDLLRLDKKINALPVFLGIDSVSIDRRVSQGGALFCILKFVSL